VELVAAGEVVIVGSSLWGSARWTQVAGQARLELEAFHQRHPLRPGMAAGELRERLGLEGRGAAEAVDLLVRSGVADRRPQGTLAIAGWEAQLTDAHRRAADAVLARLGAIPLAPPGVPELAGIADVAEVCQYLEDQGTLVRIAPDLWLLRVAVDAAAAVLRAHLETAGSVTVAQARDVLGSSRRVVVPLLEHFDAVHLTVRDGDIRRLRGTPGP
jgi:selenocysteine-specific elongation factor